MRAMASHFFAYKCFRFNPVAAGFRADQAWKVLFCATAMTLLSACASQPEAPLPETFQSSEVTAARLDALLPADVLLIGEQHDAREHQQIEQQVIDLLAERGLLAAVMLEMADVGTSTDELQPDATPEQTRQALQWKDKRWSWASYEPAVMTAVRAGVPVLGANLPRSQMRDSMADRELDSRLAGPALKAQQQAIRIGHCDLLPERKIRLMTRVQIAKDITMADAIHQAALPGMVVVLLAGNGHVDRQLGVPLHLRADLKAKAVRLLAGNASSTSPAEAFDSTWTTPALPEKDACAELKEQFALKEKFANP
jgi:uncharacterized iron-regulated protein